jgi:hypothetical protein
MTKMGHRGKLDILRDPDTCVADFKRWPGTEVAQAFQKSDEALAIERRRVGAKVSNGWQLRRLLRARRERPSQPMPHGLREAIESYRRRTAAGAK